MGAEALEGPGARWFHVDAERLAAALQARGAARGRKLRDGRRRRGRGPGTAGRGEGAAARARHDGAARARFSREVRAAALVGDHPHVVTVHDAGEWDGLPFLVLELLAGSVADQLAGGRAVPDGDGAPLARSGRGGARLPPRSRARPPRRQAGEPAPRRPRQRPRRRLRRRHGRGRRRGPDGDGRGCRDAGLPRARGRARRAGDAGVRSLLPRGRRARAPRRTDGPAPRAPRRSGPEARVGGGARRRARRRRGLDRIALLPLDQLLRKPAGAYRAPAAAPVAPDRARARARCRRRGRVRGGRDAARAVVPARRRRACGARRDVRDLAVRARREHRRRRRRCEPLLQVAGRRPPAARRPLDCTAPAAS